MIDQRSATPSDETYRHMAGNRPLEILHYARCGTLGGVENLLAPLINFQGRLSTRHHLFVRSSRIHPHIDQHIRRSAASLHYVRYWKGISIPKWPAQLVSAHINQITRRVAPDLFLIWNCLGDRHLARVNFNGIPAVYYDHAAAWYASECEQQHRFMANIDAAICCSRASERMLRLRWRFKGPIIICRNGVAASSAIHAVVKRPLAGRTLRLGIAARLTPVKGISLAIHALAELARKGYPCELHIAGSGNEQERLQALCARLDVTRHVVFAGLVKDTSSFFADIDVFLCPSLTDPFPLACLEAAAHGCTVIGNNVDGLPEIIIDGVTGILVEPSLRLQDYPRFGGTLDQLPAVVYDPASDSIQSPRLVDPSQIATAVIRLLEDPGQLARLSARARAHAIEHFAFDDYARRLLTALSEFTQQARCGIHRS